MGKAGLQGQKYKAAGKAFAAGAVEKHGRADGR